MYPIKLFPNGKTIKAKPGLPVRDLLFHEGVEFVCGGKGVCKACRVRVIEGNWPISEIDRKVISEESLRQGWRLACQGHVTNALTLEVAQWEMPVLADDTPFEFTPGEGLGIAVDLGTTTIAAQLLDLHSGEILGVDTALNAQSIHGSDVMTRLEYALNGGQETLARTVRSQVGRMVDQLLDGVHRNGRKLRKVYIAGNTAMHHLFCGLPVESLARDPFQPSSAAMQQFTSDELDWSRCRVDVRFLPCLGGFVGSDILAGIIATQLHRSASPMALLDLGTNGEIVVGNRDRILCASAAAGPAFEGARISMGMRAATGAISEVEWRAGRLECRVVSGAAPRGLCGSGLVDAIAVGLDRSVIQSNGRFSDRLDEWQLAGRVALAQRDIRELQLAKSAITSGLILLCKEWGTELENLEKVFLAGAFGNYINQRSARRIGLLPLASEKIVPAGNAALLGTKLALFDPNVAMLEEVTKITKHLSLNEHSEFQETFVEQLAFP